MSARGGYGPSIPKPKGVIFEVLTPKSIVRAILEGYRVTFRQSAES